jgi:hypothetical protein
MEAMQMKSFHLGQEVLMLLPRAVLFGKLCVIEKAMVYSVAQEFWAIMNRL